MRQCVRMFLAGLVIVGLVGCASTTPNLPPETMPGSDPGHNVLVESYKIAVGDQVQVDVWKKPEHSVSEPVRPDGKISIPLVGDVMAAGLEPQALAADIEERLKAYVLKPRVTVILTSLQGHAFLSRIRVTGSVTNNMSMPYYQGMTVLDAVLEAGGVDLYADSNRTKLYRRVNEVNETYDIRLKDILEKGDKRTNVYLVPGDVITVPPRRF
jgi:polysaccharide export outer membrane protein